MILDNDYVNIVIEHKKIKNIYFRINEQLEIYVTCPKYVSQKEIMNLLNKNHESLIKMYHKIKKDNLKKEEVYYLGKRYDFVYFKKVIIDESSGIAFGPSVEAINTYLYKNCLKHFQTRLDLYVQEFTGLPKFLLRARKMKSRWGVCNKSSMSVTLNTLLIHKDNSLIDYVICHELSHFIHMDHSKLFWMEVAKHYPNYQKARKELRG